MFKFSQARGQSVKWVETILMWLNSSVQIFKVALRLIFLSDSRFSSLHTRYKSFQVSCPIFPTASNVKEELAYRIRLSISVMQWFSAEATLPSPLSPGHLAMSGDIFFVAVRRCYLASSRWKPGMLQNIPPQQRIIGPKLLVVLGLRSFALVNKELMS